MNEPSTETALRLNPRQEAFCRAYVLEKSGAPAVRAAGYSARSARLQAHRLLRRDTVQARIRELKANPPASPAVEQGSPEWIRERYQAIASVSPADLMVPDESGRLRWKLPHELTPEQRSAVAGIKTRRANDGSLEVTGYRLHSGKQATDSLARINGLYRETATQHHTIDVRHVFELVAGSEATSETSARLRAKHGGGGAPSLIDRLSADQALRA